MSSPGDTADSRRGLEVELAGLEAAKGMARMVGGQTATRVAVEFTGEKPFGFVVLDVEIAARAGFGSGGGKRVDLDVGQNPWIRVSSCAGGWVHARGLKNFRRNVPLHPSTPVSRITYD